MRLCVFICSFYAKNALCSYEFEDSFDVCGKYGNGSLHLHGVKAVRLGSVISKNMLEFRILRLYLVSLSGLECKLWCFLKLHQPVLFLCPYRHAVSFDLCSVFIASLSARACLAFLCVEIICPNLVPSSVSLSLPCFPYCHVPGGTDKHTCILVEVKLVLFFPEPIADNGVQL